MKLGAALTLAALGCWLLALLPRPALSGRVWALADASDSMAGAEVPGDWWEAAAPDRRALFAAGLAPADGPRPAPHESRLGAALAALHPRLSHGDELRVYSDGRSTDELPPAAPWRDVRVVWTRPPYRPRISWVDAPPSWPAFGDAELVVSLSDARTGDGRLDLEAAAATPLHGAWVEVVDSRRLRVRLRASAAAGAGLELRLRWSDAGGAVDQRVVRIAPHAGAAFHCPDPELERRLVELPGWRPVGRPEDAAVLAGAPGDWPADLLRAHLARGAWLFLAAAHSSDWLQLPADLRPFQGAAEANRGLWLLLDQSGSMDGAPLQEARAAVSAWAGWWPAAAEFWVLPFRERLDAPFDPRRSEGVRRLAELAAFGPTDLAGALAALPPAPLAQAVLVVLSDGRSPAPEAGWPALAESLRARGYAVFCVPVGADADHAALGSIGALPAQPGAAVEAGLLAAFAEGGGEGGRGAVYPVAESPWSLPRELSWPEPRERFAPAPGAEALLVDASGACVAALLRSGAGFLVGLAAPALDQEMELVAALWAAAAAPPLERRDVLVWARGDAAGWTAQAGDSALPFTPAAAGLWCCGPFDPRRIVSVRRRDGTVVALPPAGFGEHETGSESWERWLQDVQAGAAAGDGLRDPWLLAALALAVAALRRATRPAA